MSHNKRKAMKEALFYLDEILKIHQEDPAALPGSVIRHVKSAKTLIKKDKMMQKSL